MVFYETKTNTFHSVISGKYFPLNISETAVSVTEGDLLTVGELHDSKKVVLLAESSSGLKLTQITDVIYKFDSK